MILHYFFDPLCGWCYGFSPVIQQFYKNHQHEMDIEVISGGMVKGEQIKPIGDMAPYLKDAYKRVEDISGVKFGKNFLDQLDDGRTIVNSVPPSIALSVFKALKPEDTLKYASELQSAIYSEGIESQNMEHFADMAEKHDLDKEDFLDKVSQDQFKKEAYDDFSVTQQYGVGGYPTVILEHNDEHFLMCNGFTDLENLENTFLSITESKQ